MQHDRGVSRLEGLEGEAKEEDFVAGGPVESGEGHSRVMGDGIGADKGGGGRITMVERGDGVVVKRRTEEEWPQPGAHWIAVYAVYRGDG